MRGVRIYMEGMEKIRRKDGIRERQKSGLFYLY